jgi:hypothetical protein
MRHHAHAAGRFVFATSLCWSPRPSYDRVTWVLQPARRFWQLAKPLHEWIAMAPVTARQGSGGVLADPLAWARWLLLEPAGFLYMSSLLLLAELVLNVAVIHLVPCELETSPSLRPAPSSTDHPCAHALRASCYTPPCIECDQSAVLCAPSQHRLGFYFCKARAKMKT